MRTWKQIAVNVVVLCGVFFVGHAMSQDKTDATAPGDLAGGVPDMQAAMKKWMSTIKPNQNHKWLEQFVGKWKTTTRMMSMEPGGKGIETSGTAEFRMANGGQFSCRKPKAK